MIGVLYMVLMSLKVSKIKFVVACVTILMAVVLGGIGLTKLTTASAANENQDTKPINISAFSAETNEKRLIFLKTFGWDVASEPCEICEVVIPVKFDDVYDKYNAIQKKQGLDLLKYAGKRVKRYTYEVKNYPDRPANIRVNMLVYNGKIIGGDVCSIELSGFMHGFKLEG